MPGSPEDFGSLVFRPTPEAPARTCLPGDALRQGIGGGLFVFILIVVLVVVPTLRTPVGAGRKVEGTVKAVGFAARGRLIASVRLGNGAIVRVRAPYEARLEPGTSVALVEQPMRFGQPVYSLSSAMRHQGGRR